jgi:hypothetical protein
MIDSELWNSLISSTRLHALQQPMRHDPLLRHACVVPPSVTSPQVQAEYSVRVDLHKRL